MFGKKNEREINQLRQTLLEKDNKIRQLETQIAQLQDINTHPGIKDIAIEASDPAFRKKSEPGILMSASLIK